MLNINIIGCWQRMLLVLFTVLCMAPVYASGNGTIVGQVLDTDGMPIAGVTVNVKHSPSVTTNSGGVYQLTGVKHKHRVLVRFEKKGYVPTQGAVSLVRKDRHDRDEQEERDDDEDRHHDSKKLSKATLSKVMLKSGATQTLNAALGGALIESGFKVTFPANSLTVSGNVDVAISPIDVSTRAVAAAPGDFSARTLSGRRVALESFSMADFTLTQNGRAVNLKPGAMADIELLLPANTPLISGYVKPLWYFNEANGLWQEEGVGAVGPSTTKAGRLAVFASVKHFSWWNSDQVMNSTAISGKVVDPNGVPLAGVSVESFGVDYAGHSYAVPTDANGNYCIQVRSSSTSKLTAFELLGSIVYSSAEMLVVSGAAQTSCASGGAQLVPNIVLSTKLSCISGDVKDVNGLPVAGAIVYLSTGGFSTTDANGLFRMAAPENSSVTVYAGGSAPVTITTPLAGSACVSVSMKPSVGGGGGVACVTGKVYVCDPSNPWAGVVVQAEDVNGMLFAISAPSDANGMYCIDGLPSNTFMSFADFGDRQSVQLGFTGIGGGSCAANTCNVGPGVNVGCY